MAELALRRMRAEIPLIAEALAGRLQEHHRYLLAMQLERVEQVEASIAALDERIDQALAPYREQLERLKQIPGVDRVIAATIIAELGVDMSVFPTAGHAAAWAGVCPGNHQSGGKSRPQAVRHGNVHLQQALMQAAVCASRQKGSYFREKYYRLRARRGPKRAAMAIAHKILRTAYTMLANHLDYQDLGAAYLDAQMRIETRKQLVRRLERVGFTVTLTQKEATPMPM